MRGVEFAVTKLVEEASMLEVFLLDAIFYVPFIYEFLILSLNSTSSVLSKSKQIERLQDETK